VIDIHTHLLPGVDDGAPTVEASLPVLERFARDGVTRVVCTPHLRATEAGTVAVERYEAIFAELVARAPAAPALTRGWEIMLDAPGQPLTAPWLRLGTSRALLVEFPRGGLPMGAGRELRRLADTGVVPVVAHPERYIGCSVDIVREWRELGAVIQTDAMMLLGTGRMTALARDMLEFGLIDCLASDNHGDGRTLATVRRWLDELGAAEQGELLTSTNPGRVLADAAVTPVAPVRLGRGVLERLRTIVFRRPQGTP